MNIFLNFFGIGKLKPVIRNGAVVIDVRSAQEYDMGRVPGSINIPVDRIATSIGRIKAMNKPVVFCCSSGDRSRKALSTARSLGLKNVYYGGSWENVLHKMNKPG